MDAKQSSDSVIENELRKRFSALISIYTSDLELMDAMWNKIKKAYSAKNRVYHNLIHLHQLFAELELYRDDIMDWEVISFSVFYHDIIYNVRRQDNEAKSADFAGKEMKLIGVDQDKINACKQQINATKLHEIDSNDDTNLLTDADLAILGKDWKHYASYTKSIRKEYKIYPNLLYRPGRKKVLSHFLSLPNIYKTPQFQHKYESLARQNLLQEFESL